MRIALLSLLIALVIGCAPQVEPITGDLVIEGVTVIDVDSGARTPNQTVVIRGNKIAAIQSTDAHQTVQATEIIDGSESFLMPGLWDMHVHAAWPQFMESFYLQLVAHGVTGIRDTWGMPSIDQAVNERIEAGDYLAPPRRIIAGNLVDGSQPVWPGSLVAADAAAGREVVDSLHEQGAPFVKVYSKLSREAYFSIATRATELGMPFAGHIPLAVTAREAAEAGQRSVEHLTEIANACTTAEAELKADWLNYYGTFGQGGAREIHARTEATFDEASCRELFELLRENEVWQVPTLITLRGGAYVEELAASNDDRLRYLAPLATNGWIPSAERSRPAAEIEAAHRRFALSLKLVGLMADLEVPILAGSDTPNPWAFPGSGLHDELALLVEAGLTPLQALQSATIHPARFFDRQDQLGTVEVGKLADLVLLDADPLIDIENVRKIHSVVADGRLLSRDRIDTELEELAANLARPSIATWIRVAMDEGGLSAAKTRLTEAVAQGEQAVNLAESELNRLGYEYLSAGRVEDAIAILELNRERFPESANCHDSLGDALKAAGRLEDAQRTYRQAVALAEAANLPEANLEAYRRNLESVTNP